MQGTTLKLSDHFKEDSRWFMQKVPIPNRNVTPSSIPLQDQYVLCSFFIKQVLYMPQIRIFFQGIESSTSNQALLLHM
jgi:hypothetical protein